MKTIADKWVIVKITSKEETYYKVFATWAGGYLDGDSWRMNSGIKHIYLEDGNYRIAGFSGSHYVCGVKSYGFASSHGRSVLDNIVEKAKSIGIDMEILLGDTDFLKLKL